MWHVRPAEPSDVRFLEVMLCEAACWRDEGPRPPGDEVLADPRMARYVMGWGRRGDAGVIAEEDSSRPIGAAWYRVFDEREPGFGFVDEDTPEISIAVLPGYRRQGVGHAILTTLLTEARASGFRALSLSVEPDNPAVVLYERVRFERVGAYGGSWTMRVDLERD